MRRLILTALATVGALAVWAAVFLAGTLEGWWRRPLAPPGDAAAFMSAAARLADAERPGALSLLLIEGGRPTGEHHLSLGAPVDRDTLFQVASLSKWVTALGVMTLAEGGRIDLDAPVDTYLKRWRLPPGDFDNRGVTVRRLLSHTAGLTDGLGYAGFEPGQPLQPLPESLARAADASPGRDGYVRVGQTPGEAWRYSGGGYTLLQLLIEDVTGETFEAYMQRAVLQPLGMARSTFVTPAEGVENLAGFYGEGGKPATHYRFTAAAAAALYTSAADMARLIQAHLPGPDGAAPGRGVLSPSTLAEMRRPHARQMGADFWGLGLILYAPNGAGGHIVGHDGNNEPAINTAARFDPASGDGIVVLESGAPLLATRLAGEWVFWRTGKVDTFLLLMEARRTATILAAGAVLILLAGVILGWRMRPRQAAA
ncbi:serine hydrolase domain-containing protein [Phenylobacterium sp.]|uniref:serine hydrolase domain-containing protein n=1 Tax=Phenylobacterium sp. TaxID=1871053 RepID=UPI00301D7F0E